MQRNIGTYDTEAAKKMELNNLLRILSDLGANRIYVKELAPNDNSKNQPYFGSHLTDLSFIPTGETEASITTSNKTKAKKYDKRKIKYQTSMKLSWFDAEGKTYPAPNAKLIYYPQYPEVRFSGFLNGSKVDASEWMQPQKKGRFEGRWLILGVARDKTVYSYLVTPECSLSNELKQTDFFEASSVFSEISTNNGDVTSTKDTLISKLIKIHNLGWIHGQKITKDGIKEPYTARNAGGYTLEAELGVIPNGIAEPDFLGWEVKQFGVTGFPAKGTRPTTLMTPEPNGGIYVSEGAHEFVKRYGYPDKSGKPDRLNFGGRHIADKVCNTTNLTLKLIGFDKEKAEITDAGGSIALLDSTDTITASWSFAKFMDHWKKKHAQAVYLPCISQQLPSGGKEYHFGKDIELGTGTNFEMILSAMSDGHVYYDPGIKLENVSTKNPRIKKRSQFRVSHKELNSLYNNYDFIDITTTNE